MRHHFIRCVFSVCFHARLAAC